MPLGCVEPLTAAKYDATYTMTDELGGIVTGPASPSTSPAQELLFGHGETLHVSLTPTPHAIRSASVMGLADPAYVAMIVSRSGPPAAGALQIDTVAVRDASGLWT